MEEVLREKVINILREQGFEVGSNLTLRESSKSLYRQVQSESRVKQLILHKKFLLENINTIRKFSIDGRDIEPHRISLELKEVQSGSLEEIIFKWWNLAWWSIPYQHPYGRQMRFLLWDKTHNAPFGLILLQSPVLKMEVRDKYLEIPREELDLWVNRSMYAQRVGALPPFNEILGGKMVALALTANEIREAYKRKYKNVATIIKGRTIESDLLFITTTSAFGKSSIYNRLKYNGEIVAISLGYTKGAGTFHIPDELYLELLEFLSQKGIDTTRGFGRGPSRKLKLISLALNHLGLPKFVYHGIKREFFLFPLVKNLKEVIKNKEEPIYVDRPFEALVEFWKERWGLPRAIRKPEWRNFRVDKFLNETVELICKIGIQEEALTLF